MPLRAAVRLPAGNARRGLPVERGNVVAPARRRPRSPGRRLSYLPLDGEKFLYLATVIDLASRRLAGWAIADHMRTDLVIDALAAAERTRGSLTGAIMHTDHGAQLGLNWSSQHQLPVVIVGAR